jgi:hypothetical protein
MIIKNPSHTLTLEQTVRVLEKFRIVFTFEGVKTKIQLQQLTAIYKRMRTGDTQAILI